MRFVTEFFFLLLQINRLTWPFEFQKSL